MTHVASIITGGAYANAKDNEINGHQFQNLEVSSMFPKRAGSATVAWFRGMSIYHCVVHGLMPQSTCNA